MTEGLSDWWRGLSAREQTLLRVLALVAALLAFWLLIVQPVLDYRSAAHAEHQLALEDLAEAQALAGRSVGDAAPLTAERVLAAARGSGLEPEVMQEGGQRVRLTIPAARADVLFNLVSQLEGQEGLTVAGMSVSTNADSTLAAEIELERGA